MRTESEERSYLAAPDGAGPHPGVVVVHELFGLNDNIRGICRRFAEEGYAALAVDLFEGRNRALCMARMFAGGLRGDRLLAAGAGLLRRARQAPHRRMTEVSVRRNQQLPPARHRAIQVAGRRAL